MLNNTILDDGFEMYSIGGIYAPWIPWSGNYYYTSSSTHGGSRCMNLDDTSPGITHSAYTTLITTSNGIKVTAFLRADSLTTNFTISASVNNDITKCVSLGFDRNSGNNILIRTPSGGSWGVAVNYAPMVAGQYYKFEFKADNDEDKFYIRVENNIGQIMIDTDFILWSAVPKNQFNTISIGISDSGSASNYYADDIRVLLK
jgi:hypothetical protein